MEHKKTEYFMVIDTETGGLDCVTDPLLEICASIYDYSGKAHGSFHRLIEGTTPDGIQTAKPANLTALKINGWIDRIKSTTQHTPATKVAEEFAGWSVAVSKQYNPAIVGHNVGFDIGFLNQFLDEYGYKGWANLFSYHKIDTLAIAAVFKQTGLIKSEKINLISLAKEFNIPHTAAHTALSDVEATAGVYLKMIALIKNLKELMGDKNVTTFSS